jgi:Tfp pilus assembly protein PilX
MAKTRRDRERGISLLLSMLALMLLSAVAIGMMYMSSTETAISSNFKGEETAYFAARAGLEEVRDRMLTSNANSIATLLPTTMPGAGGTGVLYVLQNGVTAADFQNLSGRSATPSCVTTFRPGE